MNEGLDKLPVGFLYRMATPATGQGQRYASMESYLERFYRDLHSLPGAIWLARLDDAMTDLLRKARKPDRSGDEDNARQGWFEIVSQLASMMAFAHDLALSGPDRKARLGLSGSSSGRDIPNFEEFPLCTLFSLSVVVQEFGRPVRLADTRRDSVRRFHRRASLGNHRLEPTHGQAGQGTGRRRFHVAENGRRPMGTSGLATVSRALPVHLVLQPGFERRIAEKKTT